jgi:hypothetical protein
MDETARRRQEKRQKTLPEETQKQLLRYPQKKKGKFHGNHARISKKKFELQTHKFPHSF